jgi:uncharacterized delta-60 repeat protein
MAGIAVQPDGKIVVAGGGISGIQLARYLPDGSLDPSFGDGGYVQTSFRYWGGASEIALQPDGKIVVAGGSYQGDEDSAHEVLEEFTLARYNPDGSLDSSFGTGGITNTVIPEPPPADGCFAAWSAAASALAITSGGHILAGGMSTLEDGCDPKLLGASWLALARYTPDGSLDPSFGAGGIAQTAVRPSGGVGIAVQADGKIVATGAGGLTRYDADGSLDGTFGTDGQVMTGKKLRDPSAPALQDGKILVAGQVPAKPDSRHSRHFPVLARYDATGRLDTTFGKHGFADLERVTGGPAAVLVQSDGEILVAADPLRGSGSGSVVRLRPNGHLDPHFGKRGIVPFNMGLSALASQADGKTLVSGSNGKASMLARLLGGSNCVVPDLRGRTVSKASIALKGSDCLRGRISKRSSRTVARGHVIGTAPRQGARLPGGAKVALVVSEGR